MILRGIDTLIFGLDIGNYDKIIWPVLQSIKAYKEMGQEQGKPYVVDFWGLKLTVELSGIQFYPYRLTCEDFIIYFTEKATMTNPDVKVRFMSSFLWSYGAQKAYEKFMQWFSCWGANVLRTRLSRVDMCADTDEAKFVPADLEGFVSRAKKKGNHYVSDEFINGRKFSGFTIGRGNPLLARIYDKTLEIKTSGKVWFKQLWQENGWDGEKHVWRVEFQLKREVLKELKLDSVEDLFAKEDELWAYLTGKWLLLKNKTDDNVSRWKEKRKWKIIRKAGKVGEVSPLIRESVKEGDLERLLNQANGCLISIGAKSRTDTLDKAIEILKGWGELKLSREGTDYSKKVALRRAQYINDKV